MTDDDAIKSAAMDAAKRQDVRDAVEAIYAALAKEIETRAPVCVVSGRCCRFEDYGHRLYVTTMELATFMAGLQSPGCTSGAPNTGRLPSWDGTGCPFQQNKLCSVHAIRPFGCRVFFCDPSAADWQNDQYERFHTDLKRLHETLNIPYYYVEWRQALRMLLGEN